MYGLHCALCTTTTHFLRAQLFQRQNVSRSESLQEHHCREQTNTACSCLSFSCLSCLSGKGGVSPPPLYGRIPGLGFWNPLQMQGSFFFRLQPTLTFSPCIQVRLNIYTNLRNETESQPVFLLPLMSLGS